MTAIPPSLPAAGPPAPVPAATAGLAILLADLSEALGKLPANSLITALVNQVLPVDSAPAKPAGTLLHLSTPDGPAQVRIPAAVTVPPGAKLEITVSTDGPQPQWRLLTVNDRPVTPSIATPPPPPTSTPIPTPSAGPVAAPTAPPPSPGIVATIVKSADPALPTGTSLMLRITGLIPPPSPAPATPTEPPPVAEEVPPPTPAPIGAQAPASAPAPLPAPAPVPAPVTVSTPTQTTSPTTTPDAPPTTAPTPIAATTAPPQITAAPQPQPQPQAVSSSALPTPQLAPAPPPTPRPPTEITGEILPNSDGNRPVISTPLGLISLAAEPQSLPPGAHVTLAVVGKPILPAADPPPAATPSQTLPQRLTQLIEVAQTGADDKIAETVRGKIPAPGPKLAAQILEVITSSQPQGLSRLLGDGAMTALARAAPVALQELTRQWETPAQPVQGPGDGDWRTILIPLLVGQTMTQIRLTTRRRNQGKEAAAEREKGARFLLDLDLSQLGPLQFDGLVKRQHKRFDLIIRSQAPLPGEMRRDIDGLFINGLLSFGLEGSVSFQPEGRFVAMPPLTADGNGTIFA